MHWFQASAPIRLKLLVAFGIMTMLTAVASLAHTVASGSVAFAIDIGATAVAIVLGFMFRKAIADPYVATVVRMEGLAAGDLKSPILRTDYTDCVGRLTRAMVTFRDAAADQRAKADEQAVVVSALTQGLAKLSNGDLTCDIAEDFPPSYASLKTNFNAAVAALRDSAAQERGHAAEQAAVVDLLTQGLGKLSEGDLTSAIEAEVPESYASVKTNFNAAIDSLRDLISAVGESAASIRTGSGEIAHASEDLARRTESNAASLEQTSASLVQIDGRLKATATAAASTVERADQAMTTVSGGRSIADEAVQAMGRVSDSAKGIDSVIEGLDKIAFQTRVLAMNAAVEAGRAGDAGRGFAVVADLVSALAMRAEEEAKRARDQLTVTQTDIVTAVEAVEKVDGALAKIAGDVGQVHELLGTMAADNQAQSSAITEISAAIGTMDQSTQQNAAMVEETSAAARNLTSEVGALTEQAARFKVQASGSKPAAVRGPTPTTAKADVKAYNSPVKPLPAAAVKALVRTEDDWNAF